MIYEKEIRRITLREKLKSLGFHSIYFNCYFTNEDYYYVLFLNDYVWFKETRQLSIDEVLENCGSELRDVILFNLDLFR